jgi:hypothetical protein
MAVLKYNEKKGRDRYNDSSSIMTSGQTTDRNINLMGNCLIIT